MAAKRSKLCTAADDWFILGQRIHINEHVLLFSLRYRTRLTSVGDFINVTYYALHGTHI